MSNLTRRALLAAAGVAPLAAQLIPQGKVRLGGPIFVESDDPGRLAREHRRLGYSAAYCPKADANDAGATKAIEQSFARENVTIAEVGAWVNMLDPDQAKRGENLRYVATRLALAEAVGARCCVDIAGSYNPDIWYGPHPKNFSQEFFDATVENCRRIIDEVKPTRTRFTIEMMGWALPSGPDEYLRLIRAVDRQAFAVHMDVCNGINSPERYYRNTEFIEECFKKLGRWVASCHAKDLAWLPEMNVHFAEVVPGRGKVDYSAYLRSIATYSPDAPLMLEHLKTPEEYDEGRGYIQAKAKEAGVLLA